MSRVKSISLAGVTADDDAIVAGETPAAGGVQSLTIAAQPPQAILLGVKCTGNDAGRSFVITGTDRFGEVITETVSGADAGTTATTKQFLTVTSITVDDDTAGLIEVGYLAVVYGAWYPLNAKWFDEVNIGFRVVVTGTVNFDLEYTFDDLMPKNGGPGGDVEATVSIVTDPDLDGDTATIYKSLTFRAEGIRLKINSGTGSLRATVAQAGNR